MKKVLLGFSILLALASLLSAAPFLRPIAAYVSPTTDGYSDTGAVGFVGGVEYGQQQEHELSFEWSWARFDAQVRVGAFSASGTTTYMPYLVNYRYRFGAAASPVRFYAGPSVGLTNVLAKVAVSGPGLRASGDDSAWAFTASGSAGLLFKLTEKVDIDVGYRFMSVASTDVAILGANLSLERSEAHAVYLGIGFKY